MKIGIDISQIVYEGTGVSRYVKNLVRTLIETDPKNEYVLFGSSFRRRSAIEAYFQSIKEKHTNVSLKLFPFPPTLLDILWNRLHIIPIEWLIGEIDIFWSSDWTQPPLKGAKGMTTIHDVSFLRFPESFPSTILNVQKRRLSRVFKTCKTFLCDSIATKNDVIHFYKVPAEKIIVIYPGVQKSI
jgi:hypothetical protein